MKTVNISINLHIVGKPTKNDRGFFVDRQGSSINLGKNWITTHLSLDDLWESLTVDGFAVASALLPEADGVRASKNFLSHQIALVDIDGGMEIEELFSNDFYEQYALGFYTTPSHTDSAPRFRIAFYLENPVLTEARMKSLYIGLLEVFNAGDKSCKDGARLFYGTPNCPVKEFRPERVLPQTVIDELIVIAEQLSEPLKVTAVNNTGSSIQFETTEVEKVKILRLLKEVNISDYSKWRNVGWALRSGGYSLNDFLSISNNDTKTHVDAEKIWNSFDSTRGITMGSIGYLLKSELGADALKKTRKEKQMSKILKSTSAFLKKQSISTRK